MEQAVAESKKGLSLFLRSERIYPDERQAGQLWSYYQLLRECNRDRDLTRITRFDDVVIRHFLDCAIIGRIFELPSPLVDIGSGAGFPGIVLKILYPHLDIILAEARKKRASFLEYVISELGLTGIACYPHRVGPHFDRPVQGAVCRALAPVPRVLDIVRHFLPKGGYIVLMKGPHVDRERNKADEEDFELVETKRYALAGTAHRRTLLVFRRRRESIRRKRPLSYGGVTEIISPANDTFRRLLRLQEIRNIRKQRRCLLSGAKITDEAMRHSEIHICSVIGSIGMEIDEFRDRLGGSAKILLLSEALFRQLDIFGTGYPLLEIRVPSLLPWDASESLSGVEVFLPLQDPGNLGMVLRSACALGVQRAVILKEGCHPFHPRALRASSLAPFWMDVRTGPSLSELADMLPKEGLALLDTDGIPLDRIKSHRIFRLVIGEEGRGLSLWSDRDTPRYAIPMISGIDSLNAAAAASIAIYALVALETSGRAAR